MSHSLSTTSRMSRIDDTCGTLCRGSSSRPNTVHRQLPLWELGDGEWHKVLRSSQHLPDVDARRAPARISYLPDASRPGRRAAGKSVHCRGQKAAAYAAASTTAAKIARGRS